MKNTEVHYNQYYKRYLERKNKIKEKYPKELFFYAQGHAYKEEYIENQQQLYKQYIKEIADLLFEKEGVFQKFVWDNLSEADKDKQDRISRGASASKTGEYSVM